MARNEEKALTLFSKWTSFKKDFHAAGSNRRPLVAGDSCSLPDAEKQRRELVSTITKKISSIQNATQGEHRIRELNDEINALMKKKHYWEIRIRELGGGDYKSRGKQIMDIEGREVPGVRGYRYYGAAKELPGVRELFAEKADEVVLRKRNRADLYKSITPDYYGFRDDEDGVLVAKEAARERVLLAAAAEEYAARKRALQEDVQRSGGVFGAAELANLLRLEEDEEEEEEEAAADGLVGGAAAEGEPVVDEESVATFLVEQRKRSLMDAYLA